MSEYHSYNIYNHFIRRIILIQVLLRLRGDSVTSKIHIESGDRT